MTSIAGQLVTEAFESTTDGPSLSTSRRIRPRESCSRVTGS